MFTEKLFDVTVTLDETQTSELDPLLLRNELIGSTQNAINFDLHIARSSQKGNQITFSGQNLPDSGQIFETAKETLEEVKRHTLEALKGKLKMVTIIQISSGSESLLLTKKADGTFSQVYTSK